MTADILESARFFFLSVSLSAWNVACSTFRLHRLPSASRMTHPYVPSPEGLLCLSAQSRQSWGETRTRAVTRVLYRTISFNSRTVNCSFVWGGPGGDLPELDRKKKSGGIGTLPTKPFPFWELLLLQCSCCHLTTVVYAMCTGQSKIPEVLPTLCYWIYSVVT